MILSFKEFLQESSDAVGTYAALKFNTASKYLIERYVISHKIPNPVKSSKLHVTLLYSRKHMEGFTARGTLKASVSVRVTGFDVWDTKDGVKALVARLDAPEVVARHKELMDTYKGTYDYPDYLPHFTMSYDCGDIEPSNLPPFAHPLILSKEYGEDLDLNGKYE